MSKRAAYIAARRAQGYRYDWLVKRRWHGFRLELVRLRDRATASFRANGFLCYLGLPGLLVVLGPRSEARGSFEPRRSLRLELTLYLGKLGWRWPWPLNRHHDVDPHLHLPGRLLAACPLSAGPGAFSAYPTVGWAQPIFGYHWYAADRCWQERLAWWWLERRPRRLAREDEEGDE